MEIKKLLECGRKIRVIGFDDAHWRGSADDTPVSVAGVVCSDTRFEGMLWGELTKNGMDSTESIATLLGESKFAQQVQLILLDGITFGGANVIDMPLLSQSAGVPVIAVMRKPPNLKNFKHLLSKMNDAEERLRRHEAAGPIHTIGEFVFQVVGLEPNVAAGALRRLTDVGLVPETLRLSHLIGSAVKLGQSGKRA